MSAPHGATPRHRHQPSIKPALDMAKARARDSGLDQELLQQEHANRAQIASLRSVDGDDPLCYGVTIDHMDVIGKPPGDSWKQCSLGAGCTAPGMPSLHVKKLACAFLSNCPRCHPPNCTRTRPTRTPRPPLHIR
jgi:hypothetical protein